MKNDSLPSSGNEPEHGGAVGMFALTRNHSDDRNPGWPGCLSDRQAERGGAWGSLWPHLPGSLCGRLSYVPAVTQPLPMTHLNKLKSASDFHSVYLNFHGGGSYPTGGCGAPHSPSAHPLFPGSGPHRAHGQPDSFPGLGRHTAVSQ